MKPNKVHQPGLRTAPLQTQTGWAQAFGQRPHLLLLGIAVFSLLAVGAALFTQQVWKMQPCPWCILQRVIFLALAAVALLGAVSTALLNRITQRLLAAVLFALAAGGAAAALWQHFVASSSTSCALTFADRFISNWELDTLWPTGFAVGASCAEAKVKLFGLPYEFWSLALFTFLAGLALTLWLTTPRRRNSGY